MGSIVSIFHDFLHGASLPSPAWASCQQSQKLGLSSDTPDFHWNQQTMAEPIDQPRGYEDEDDDEREGDLHRERRHAFRGGRVERIPLHDLLQILAGQRVVVDPDQRNADSNDDLVANLKRSGMLSRCAHVPARQALMLA